MRRVLLLGAVALGACRPPANVPRDTPLDFASLPGPTGLSTEATLFERWAGPLKAHQRAGEPVQFAGVDGLTLRGLIHRAPNPRAAVVLLTGRAEAVEKYAELIDDLNAQGFSTYAMDHRGQGASDRLLPNREKSHVLYFQDYVTDLRTFITSFVQKDQPSHLFIVAHSMGAAITTLYVDQFPDGLSGVVLSAPMYDLKTSGFPPAIASSLGLTACSASDGSAYVLGAGDYKDDADFSKNSVSSSQQRWEWKRQLARDDPGLRLGGTTWRWLCEALTASSAIQSLGRYSPVPTLILQAGDDRLVNTAAQDRYCADAPRCQLTRFPDARHEVLHERDEIRNEAVSQLVKFLNARVRP